MEFSNEVLVEERNFARVITLNRPRQLNVLSIEMIKSLEKLLIAYEEDPSVKLLILKGKGKAFCAGGDAVEVMHAANDGHWSHGAKNIWIALRSCYLFATHSKPQISLLNGIVMGGASSLSIHGMFQVATEKTVFAMPETSLGLFPDVGSTYFLARLPGFFGEYVGLTGAWLNGAEMLASGLVTHFVPFLRLSALEESLINEGSSDPVVIRTVIDRYSELVPVQEASAFKRLDIINRCFSKKSVEEIIHALEEEKETIQWILDAVQSLKKASPMSLKITLRSIREGRLQTISQCLIKDYRIFSHVLHKEASKDFFEGCRALLVDKDNSPMWEPSRLELIDDAMVDRYFSKVDEEGWEDLKLPHRQGYGVPPTSNL